MSQNKILLNHRVITKGGGNRRAVLDFDSGLVYSYSEPDRILAMFQPGQGWITVKRPSYISGGWGRPGRGDADGSHLVGNAQDLIRSIGGRLLELNVDQFMTQKELNDINDAINRHNKLVKIQNKTAQVIGRHGFEAERLESIKTIKAEVPYNYRTHKGPIKGIDPIKTALNMKSAVKTFIDGKGKAVKVDGYTIQPDLVTILNRGSEDKDPLTVAFRDSKGQVYLNSQVIPMTAFEHEFMGSQSLIQQEIRTVAKYSIPFNVLESAKLKLNETAVLEQGPESTHQLKSGQERHFTGALLLGNAGRKFLMDLDRIEIQHGLFNVFFVEVNPSVNSIDEAYESMKPMEVKEAESKGLEVRRQGEWFFIETTQTVTVPESDVFTWEPGRGEDVPKQYIVRQAVSHGKGRPNNLFVPRGFGHDFEKDRLVCGTVSHQGREHKDLDLGSKVIDGPTAESNLVPLNRGAVPERFKEFRLWKLVGNTTVSNFTITGDVD